MFPWGSLSVTDLPLLQYVRGFSLFHFNGLGISRTKQDILRKDAEFSYHFLFPISASNTQFCHCLKYVFFGFIYPNRLKPHVYHSRILRNSGQVHHHWYWSSWKCAFHRLGCISLHYFIWIKSHPSVYPEVAPHLSGYRRIPTTVNLSKFDFWNLRIRSDSFLEKLSLILLFFSGWKKS